jgi:kumamolisin
LTVVSGVRQESVWNDGDGSATGGGINAFFPVPDYQQSLAMPVDLVSGFKGRGVPDVSAVADPQTGYAVFVHGQWMVVGGTSAVAPLYAGLVARLNERMNKQSGNTVWCKIRIKIALGSRLFLNVSIPFPVVI